MRLILILTLALTGLAACAEDAFRDDFDSVTAWEAQLTWLKPISERRVAVSENGVGRFATPEPERGMKWRRQLEDPVDIELTPWLVIRYRATNFNPSADYLVWLNDEGGKGGVSLPAGKPFPADGQWHTWALDLTQIGLVPPIGQIALQCFSDANGDGELLVDYIAITDTPPQDAEGLLAAQEGTGQEWPVAMDDPGQWTVQPSWVNNFTDKSRASAGEKSIVFSVPEGGRGAKWSRSLREPIEGARYAMMRYRARNLQSWGDYTVYIAATGGGKSAQEQYVIKQADIIADGTWHVAVGRVTVPTINTIAVQVQAARGDAMLEIADLRFTDRKPVIKLVDTLDLAQGFSGDAKAFRMMDLPAGNSSGEDLSRKLGAQGWVPDGLVTVSGLPFTIRPGAAAVNMSPLKERGEIAAPLGGKAAEAYLLLAAQFPASDEPSYAGTGGAVRHVNRLVARIEYADGSSEEQFPFSVSSGQHAVSRWLHVYALALDPAKALKKLTLVDGMARGSFGLVALTLGEKPGPATAATRVLPAVQLPKEKPVASRAAGIKRNGDILSIDAWTVSMALDLARGLRVASLTNHSGVGLNCRIAPGPLFRVTGERLDVNSEQFKVVKVAEEGQATRLDLRCEEVTPALGVTVWVDVTDPREIGLRASIDLGGRDPAQAQFIFPEVRQVTFVGKADDLTIWCPRRGDVITAENVSLREPYAGAGNPFQIIGAFDPRLGTGLYMMTQDMDALSRFYQVQKSTDGARLAVEYTPLHEGRTGRTVIGCSQGDWHAQLGRYQEWAATWYKAAAPRKRWFREVFNFRQQFLHFALPTTSGMFDPETKALRIKEVFDQDAEAFGGADYLHLFDWGWDPVHGRCGDYVPWEYLGGVEKFRQGVAEVQAEAPVGLYIEGILVDPTSDLGKAHGEQWQMLDAAGKPYTYFAPSYHICPALPEWQDYLSGTYQRVARETGAKGFYIDEYGFSSTSYWCHNPAHGHPVPMTPVLGERGMLQQVRAKLGPDAAIYTEESPTDVNAQYQDGSFTYNISTVSDELSPTHVNLYRFAFPDFKTIEIITCDRPLGTNVEAVKRILFNGEAIWLEGIEDKWFAPETRAAIAQSHKVLRDNRQCFAGDYPVPLVPTLLSGVYANQFGERPDLLGKTCWTVYNTNYRTVRGEVIAVDHAPGCQYLDELTGKPLKARVVGKKAYLTLDMAPRDVLVVSRGLYVK